MPFVVGSCCAAGSEDWDQKTSCIHRHAGRKERKDGEPDGLLKSRLTKTTPVEKLFLHGKNASCSSKRATVGLDLVVSCQRWCPSPRLRLEKWGLACCFFSMLVYFSARTVEKVGLDLVVFCQRWLLSPRQRLAIPCHTGFFLLNCMHFLD